MIVVDASVILESLLRISDAPLIDARLFNADQNLLAPHLIDVEVTQVLRRYALAGELSPARGDMAVEDLQAFPLTRYPHADLMPRVWGLRHNVTAYDAVYIALAEALQAPLLTRDRRLAQAPGHGVRIDVI